MEGTPPTPVRRRRVLLLGAGGFLGRYANDVLSRNGHAVIPVRRPPPSPSPPAGEGEVLLHLAQEGALGVLDRIDCDVVVQCAAVLPSSSGAADEEAAAEANRHLDDLVIELCRRHGRRLVYPSGANVYGRAPTPWREDGPIDPVGPYALAKAETERAISAHLPDAAVLRISAPYGPGQRARTVLRVFLERAVAGADLAWHGTGCREQDFVAVEDAADAMARAVSSDVAAGVVNVGSGCPVSMRRLAEIVVSSVPGCRSRIAASGQPDPQEGYRPRLDLRRARQVLRWQSRISLEEGVLRWARHLTAARR